MVTSLQLADANPALAARVRYCRRLLNRRALVAAAASAVPIPGLDWAVDAALLGLTPEQLDKLPHHKREQVQKAVGAVGSMLVGKLITRDLVVRAAKVVGMRMTVKQAVRYVPLAGQAVSALMGYATIRYLGEEHIKDCIRVMQAADLELPELLPGNKLKLR